MLKRKLWSQEEDEAIKALSARYGIQNWTLISQKLSQEYNVKGRTGKQCRERWHNHLDPNISKDPISPEEESIIFYRHREFGNKWAEIASFLKGRSDNSIKNQFYSTLRKFMRKINKSFQHRIITQLTSKNMTKITTDQIDIALNQKQVTYEQLISINPKKLNQFMDCNIDKLQLRVE